MKFKDLVVGKKYKVVSQLCSGVPKGEIIQIIEKEYNYFIYESRKETQRGFYYLNNDFENLPLEENENVSSVNDLVNHPSHYNKGKYEVIDVIEDWGLGFSLGNAIKYIARCEHKGNKKQDLEKAIFYLKRELEKEE